LLSSPSKNAIDAAISQGSARSLLRIVGMRSLVRENSPIGELKGFEIISVLMAPLLTHQRMFTLTCMLQSCQMTHGHRALTLTPLAATSKAATFVRPMIACFAATYPATPAEA
jgi:hypothetical protein